MGKNKKMGSLVLTRKPMETICVGDDVRVTVIRVKGDRVRIKIEAPISLSIDRLEIREKIEQETEKENANE